MAYPSGHVVTNTFDNAGRIATVTGNGKTYATSSTGGVQYYPHGAMKSMTHANGLVESVTVNNRLQPTSITAGSLLTLRFAYTPPLGSTTPTTAGNNGNIYEQTITPGGGSIYVHYDYDGLNRIQWASGYSSGAPDPTTNLNCPVSGSTASWCQHFAPDGYGNRVVDNVVGMSRPPSQPTAFSASTNRVTAGGMTWNYDYNGNVMTDGAGSSFTYDAENRMLTGGGATYVYDGQGRRVSTTLNGTTTTFVYDAAGELTADYTTGTVASPCGLTCYLTADHLGSTRLVTNGSMLAVERVDYMPYGEEISFGAGTVQSGVVGYGGYVNGDVRQRFTGKERDAETGLDYFGARYFSAVQGRFTSADAPFNDQNPADPQSWNLYSYVRNNPLRYTDPTGEDCVYINNAGNGSVGLQRGNCTEAGGTYVNGTIDEKSFAYDSKTNSIGYTYSNPAEQTGGAGSISLPDPEEAVNRAGAAQIAGSQLIVNEFAKQALYGAVGRIAGRLVGVGIEAVLAARAARAAVAAEAEAIQFGKVSNQVYHTFRHVQEAGVSVQAAKEAILNDIALKGSLSPGLTTGTVNVGGRSLTYNAFKLADGTINVGRITVK